jgi:ABC-type dipeptide/oligopeptide/nickel transport system ATPase component
MTMSAQSKPHTPLLSVSDLTVTTARGDRLVSGVSFSLDRGKCLALVGESGSGKSMTAMSVAGLLPDGIRADGALALDGTDLLSLSLRERRALSGPNIGYVFQDAMSALHPLMSIREQLTRPMRLHLDMSRTQADARALDLLDRVGIKDPHGVLHGYIHQLSGGMRQRVMIAMAICCDPVLLIADEPTTALDAAVQGKILELLADLRTSLDIAILLISHDLALVAKHSHDVAVMYQGDLKEQGPTDRVLHTPEHPYTKSLLAASPERNRDARRLPTIADFTSDSGTASLGDDAIPTASTGAGARHD